MKTIIVKVPHTNAREKALLRLGFKSESRGGDATRSTEMGNRVHYTEKVTMVWRTDGREMTTGDIRAVRAVLKA